MTETYTGGTIKVSLPSNYAENRRGAEVTLHYTLPEDTTCEQAASANDRVAAEALRVATAIQEGKVSGGSGPITSSFGASDVAGTLPAPAPEKTAEPKRSRKNPSEVVIGASTSVPASSDSPSPFAPAAMAAAPTEQPPAPASSAAPAATASPFTGGNGSPFAAGPAASSPPPAPQPASTGVSDDELKQVARSYNIRLSPPAVASIARTLLVEKGLAEENGPPMSITAVPPEHRPELIRRWEAAQ